MYEQQLPSRDNRDGRHWRKVSPCAGENSVPHQLRDADLDVTVEKIKETRRKDEDLLLLNSQTFLHKELWLYSGMEGLTALGLGLHKPAETARASCWGIVLEK